MNNRVYVGNISYDANEEDLKEFFMSCGEVKVVRLIVDRETGRPRGYAFVTFSAPGEAIDAIHRLNQVEFMNRPLVVKEAEDRRPETGFRKDSGPVKVVGNNFDGNRRVISQRGRPQTNEWEPLVNVTQGGKNSVVIDTGRRRRRSSSIARESED